MKVIIIITGGKKCFTKHKHRAQATKRAEKCRFLSLVTLTFDL